MIRFPQSGVMRFMTTNIHENRIDVQKGSAWKVASRDELRASGQVQSLNRALKLLIALSHHPAGLSLSALAREVGLPTSTAHRLLTTLQNERFVRFDRHKLTWQIGAEAARVGLAYAADGEPTSQTGS